MFKVDHPADGKRTPQPPAPERRLRPYSPPKMTPLALGRGTQGKPFYSPAEIQKSFGPS